MMTFEMPSVSLSDIVRFLRLIEDDHEFHARHDAARAEGYSGAVVPGPLVLSGVVRCLEETGMLERIEAIDFRFHDAVAAEKPDGYFSVGFEFHEDSSLTFEVAESATLKVMVSGRIAGRFHRQA